MNVMKTSLIFPLACLVLATSCTNKNAEKSAESTVNFAGIIDEMVKNEELDTELADAIKNKIKEQSSSIVQQIVVSEEDRKNAVTVNSVQLLKEIHKDRSLNLDKYLGKTLIIKDLLLYNISTEDQGNAFVKKVSAFPYDPKSNAIAVSKSSYGDDNYYTFNGNPLNTIDEIGAYQGPSFFFELNEADMMKKINALEWECTEYDNFEHKVSILIKNFSKDNLEYEAGKENENDMKAKRIKINLNGAEIIK